MEHVKEKPDQPAQIPNITPSPPSNGFLHSSVGKESVCNAGDLDLIPGLGRSPGEGKGCPLQYSGLENSMDRGASWAMVPGVVKSLKQLRT